MENFEEFGTPKHVVVAAVADPTPRQPSLPGPVSGIDKIAEALAKAQSEIQQPQKNKTVTVKKDGVVLYTHDYADYNAIVEAIRGPLSKNGIAFVHLLTTEARALVLKTQLIHSSGQILESVYPLPSSTDPKVIGGAITYGKRYCLSAITGCVADDDVDSDPANVSSFQDRKAGSAAPAGPAPKGATPSPVKPKDASPWSPSTDQLGRLFAIAGDKGWTNDQVKMYIEHAFKIGSTKALTRDQYDFLISVIEAGSFSKAMVSGIGKA